MVKIGDKIFDSGDQPIMLIMDQNDKENISSMTENVTKYCAYPDNINENEIRKFMKI